jgi:hypothetical protein
MDPDVALHNVKTALEKVQNDLDMHSLIDYDNVIELIQNLAALDEWLSKGGFLPNQWQPKKESA